MDGFTLQQIAFPADSEGFTIQGFGWAVEPTITLGAPVKGQVLVSAVVVGHVYVSSVVAGQVSVGGT